MPCDVSSAKLVDAVEAETCDVDNAEDLADGAEKTLEAVLTGVPMFAFAAVVEAPVAAREARGTLLGEGSSCLGTAPIG